MIFENRNVIIKETSAPNCRVVLCLHGGNGSAQFFQNQLKLENKISDALIVYPDGSNMINGSNKIWRSGGKFGSGMADVNFLINLVDYIYEHYNIDIERVYLLGMSNGGMMAYRLASQLGISVSGLIAISSTPLLAEPLTYIPKVLHIHGVNDENIPVQGNDEYRGIIETIGLIKDNVGELRVEIIGHAGHELSTIKTSYPAMYDTIKNFIV